MVLVVGEMRELGAALGRLTRPEVGEALSPQRRGRAARRHGRRVSRSCPLLNEPAWMRALHPTLSKR